jgi:hypothetical protein
MDPGAIVETGFAQGPQKLNDGSGKMNYPGTIDRGFTVLEYYQHFTCLMLFVKYFTSIMNFCYNTYAKVIGYIVMFCFIYVLFV